MFVSYYGFLNLLKKSSNYLNSAVFFSLESIGTLWIIYATRYLSVNFTLQLTVDHKAHFIEQSWLLYMVKYLSFYPSEHFHDLMHYPAGTPKSKFPIFFCSTNFTIISTNLHQQFQDLYQNVYSLFFFFFLSLDINSKNDYTEWYTNYGTINV